MATAENGDYMYEGTDEAFPSMSTCLPPGSKRFTGFSDDYFPKRDWTGFDSDSSDSRSDSHSSCSTLNCPVRLTYHKKLYAFEWTNEQTTMLHWHCDKFPPLISTFTRNAMSNLNLPGNVITQEYLKRFCFKPVMQWLLEPGTFEPPKINKSEVSTITVSEDVKNEIVQELTGSYFCKVAVVVMETTSHIELKNLTYDSLHAIIMAIQDVPKTYLRKVSPVFSEWLMVYQEDSSCTEENAITAAMHDLLSFLFQNEELVPHELYQIKFKGSTRRQFAMSGLKHTAETDVEVRVVDDGPNYPSDMLHNYKVLTFAENKARRCDSEAAHPEMICQFVAAAKHAPFSTATHHILYSVSAHGKNTILLTRAHVWKQLVGRAAKCATEEPGFENSHFLYRVVEYHDNECFDVFPILNIYMAIKAILLLHLKTHLNKKSTSQD